MPFWSANAFDLLKSSLQCERGFDYTVDTGQRCTSEILMTTDWGPLIRRCAYTSRTSCRIQSGEQQIQSWRWILATW